MTWALTVLFMQLIANLRSPHGLAGIMPASPWLRLVVSLVLLSMSVLVGRRFMPSRLFRLQRHAVQ
jgi:membrane protein implicated in regulation of membrane protease activity